MSDIFFTSPEHKAGLLTAMQALGKIDKGKLDSEYGAALYILLADLDTWQQAQEYVDHDGINFEALLREVDFSGAYSNLIRLAGNLFNGRVHVDPVELYRLDERNFQLAMAALQIRRTSLLVEDLAEPESEEQPPIDWRAIEAQAEIDLAAIVTDQDAYRFIERYLTKDLQYKYRALYRSDTYEMGRTPQQAVKNLLSLPSLE